MKRIITSITAIVAIMGGVLAFAPMPSASAINVFNQCSTNSGSAVCGAQGTDNATSMIETVINTLLFILGAIAVVMIVIGGIRYTTANGEAANLQAAKNTILYAVVGLVVAILSYAIVNFVVGIF